MNRLFIFALFAILLASAVFANDKLAFLCGNQVCDENENPWVCAKDCPIDQQTIKTGEILGQYWVVRGLIILITLYVMWSMFKDGKK